MTLFKILQIYPLHDSVTIKFRPFYLLIQNNVLVKPRVHKNVLRIKIIRNTK